MTYSTPELLLVGGAQNLVLITPGVSSDGSTCRLDNIFESDQVELW